MSDLANRAAAIQPWFHSIALPGGVVTPGAAKLDTLKRCADVLFGMGVKGLSVLDVGAWDGFYSFEAEQRGASYVLAADYFVWRPGGPGRREAFELAREALGSRVRDMIIDIPETTLERVGRFDVVLFNGIFYHILDPIHALFEMSRIARYVLTVETWVEHLNIPRAVMNFFPYDNNPPGFPQTGWGPNSLLMHALLKRIGFNTVLEWPTPSQEPRRSIFIALKKEHPFQDYVERNWHRAIPRGAKPELAKGLSDHL